MQCAYAMLSSVACPDEKYFSTLSDKNGKVFGEEKRYGIEKSCFDSLV
jgi:hypothetical protein